MSYWWRDFKVMQCQHIKEVCDLFLFVGEWYVLMNYSFYGMIYDLCRSAMRMGTLKEGCRPVFFRQIWQLKIFGRPGRLESADVRILTVEIEGKPKTWRHLWRHLWRPLEWRSCVVSSDGGRQGCYGRRGFRPLLTDDRTWRGSQWWKKNSGE